MCDLAWYLLALCVALGMWLFVSSRTLWMAEIDRDHYKGICDIDKEYINALEKILQKDKEATND